MRDHEKRRTLSTDSLSEGGFIVPGGNPPAAAY